MSVYRLAPTWIAKATFTASTTNIIEQFAIQSDQSLTRPWMVVDREVYPERQRTEPTASQLNKTDGPFMDGILLAYITRGMSAYLDTYMGWSDDVASVKATWMTLGRGGTWDVYQGYANRPVKPRRYPGGAWSVLIDLVGGTKL